MKTVTVNVTAQDIAQGERYYRFRCPVALAGARAFGVESVCVGTKKMAVGHKSIPLPPAAVDWIRDNDRCEPVSPITFELEVPE